MHDRMRGSNGPTGLQVDEFYRNVTLMVHHRLNRGAKQLLFCISFREEGPHSMRSSRQRALNVCSLEQDNQVDGLGIYSMSQLRIQVIAYRHAVDSLGAAWETALSQRVSAEADSSPPPHSKTASSLFLAARRRLDDDGHIRPGGDQPVDGAPLPLRAVHAPAYDGDPGRPGVGPRSHSRSLLPCCARNEYCPHNKSFAQLMA